MKVDCPVVDVKKLWHVFSTGKFSPKVICNGEYEKFVR
jgi:hypothetical protein